MFKRVLLSQVQLLPDTPVGPVCHGTLSSTSLLGSWVTCVCEHLYPGMSIISVQRWFFSMQRVGN